MIDLSKFSKAFHSWFETSNHIESMCNALRRVMPRSKSFDATENVRDNGYKDGWMDALAAVENFQKQELQEEPKRTVPYAGRTNTEL